MRVREVLALVLQLRMASGVTLRLSSSYLRLRLPWPCLARMYGEA